MTRPPPLPRGGDGVVMAAAVVAVCVAVLRQSASGSCATAVTSLLYMCSVMASDFYVRVCIFPYARPCGAEERVHTYLVHVCVCPISSATVNTLPPPPPSPFGFSRKSEVSRLNAVASRVGVAAGGPALACRSCPAHACALFPPFSVPRGTVTGPPLASTTTAAASVPPPNSSELSTRRQMVFPSLSPYMPAAPLPPHTRSLSVGQRNPP